MHNLYDLGYNDIRDASLLAEIAARLGALVFDIRHAPASRNPQWRKAALEARLPSIYRHIPALGNRNYKGGPMAIVDMDGGMKEIENALQERPVILICACWNREACHRLVVTEKFARRGGKASIPIHRSSLKEVLGEADASQAKDDPQLRLW